MTREKKKRILVVFLALVLLISVGMMVYQHLQYEKIAADSAEAAQVAGRTEQSEAPQPSPTATPEPLVPPEEQSLPPEPLPEEAAALAGIDLEALRAVNEDVVGWIEIPGTELSYPLVQGTDNQYYLTHNWKKEYSSGGSVFLESTNHGDLSDYHTLAYAHRMRNDTMFGTLKYYQDLDFWQEHPRVYVVTADGVYRYDIFSAFVTEITSMVYYLDLSGREERFVRFCLDNSVIDTGVVPEAGQRILTLSTCVDMGTGPNRWVVHGYLAQIYSIES